MGFNPVFSVSATTSRKPSWKEVPEQPPPKAPKLSSCCVLISHLGPITGDEPRGLRQWLIRVSRTRRGDGCSYPATVHTVLGRMTMGR